MSELIDNRSQRTQSLKVIMHELHQGADPQQVKARLAEVVRHASPAEVAAMEQQLIAEGVSVQQIKSMCDVHAAVVKDLLCKPSCPELAPGHPADTMRRENDAIREELGRLRSALGELAQLPADAPFHAPLGAAKRAVNNLMDVDKHYQRKENLLFSCLERHGITGPSKVMWAKDDEARAALKELHAALFAEHASGPEAFAKVRDTAEMAIFAVGGMTEKEDNILLPMSLQMLTEEEWGEIWQQSPPYGWCLVAPRSGYAPPASVQPAETVDLPRGKSVNFPTGALTFEQIVGIFDALPVDLTFVDADDRVRYFSESGGRIFARSPVILGRKVQHCHPPDSVDVVNRILADFRAGRQDVAQFWIHFRGRFVHIRYFAVRDRDGQYLGTLEVTQDITPLRALDGERRLLAYDEPSQN